MGLFDKIQKSVKDKIDSKVNEANEYITKKQEEINSWDMDKVNKVLTDKLMEKVNQMEKKTIEEDSVENNVFAVNKKSFCCFACGNDNPNGNKKTIYGKLCGECIEKLGERNIELKQVKNYSEAQIKALCNKELNACEVLPAFMVDNPPIVLGPEEQCYYVGNACGAKIKTITTGHVGASKGTTIRIMKGVSYHVGGSKGQAVREQVLDKSPEGTFVMTGNRFVLLTTQYGFEIAGNKLNSIELRPDGFAIFQKNKTHIVLSEDVKKIAVIMQLLISATEEEQKKLLEEKEKTPKKRKSKKVEEQTNEGLSSADEIRKYKQLMDEGIITEEEFEKKKHEILGF